MPKFLLNGQEIEFSHGQTIIEAAANTGIDIPHFCWHPKLSVSGNCRVCLVEIEKMPKLMIACSTLAAEGMVVHSVSEKAIAARNAVMEFLLINHPLDCPICDEAGECKLQDYAYQHGVGESRFTEEKNHKDKRVPLGPNVMFDGDRCISCSRCIRFCDEVAKENQLTFVQRGDRVTIVTFPGKELDNPYSLNVTDICPVGALTNRDFRFQARVWDLSSTKSVCAGCARGCNMEMWVRQNEILRLTPRHNEEVNSYWMCDYGRLETFKHIHAETRVDGPHLRRDGKLTRVTWDEAYAAAASELKGFSSEEIAFLGSAHATIEDNYMLAKLARAAGGSKYLDFIRFTIPGSGDEILIREDKAPNSAGAELAGVRPVSESYAIGGIIQGIRTGKIRALYVLEDDIAGVYPELREHIKKLDLLITHAVNFNATTDAAGIVFPAAAYAEKHGTWMNFQHRVQRIRPAVSTIEIDRALDGLSMSRLDKFGTEYDRWGKTKKIDARAGWKILAGILFILGQKQRYAMAEEVFDELAAKAPALAGLDYDRLGESGAVAAARETKNVLMKEKK